MSVSTLVILAAESHGEPPISPWAVGGICLGVLLFALLVLLAFGGGREHS